MTHAFTHSMQFSNSRLRDASLAPATLRTYTKNFNSFLSFSQLTLDTFLISRSSKIDRLLSASIEHLHSIGAPFDYASHALNGIIFRKPSLKLKLGVARQCLRGWRRMRHTSSHPPLTWELTVTIAVTQAKWGYHTCAVATILSFHYYLRVGELTRLRRSDIITPSDPRMGSGHVGMAIRLARTKTGVNQSVSITNRHVQELILAWLHHDSHRTSSSDLVFPFTPSHFRHLLHSTVSALGLSPTPYVPHSLRHGGATHDFMQGRSIEQIMFRGRWKAMEPARRYIQQGRAMLAQQNVPLELHRAGTSLARCLVPIMQHYFHTVPSQRLGSRRRVTFADRT